MESRLGGSSHQVSVEAHALYAGDPGRQDGDAGVRRVGQCEPAAEVAMQECRVLSNRGYT